MKTQHIKNIQKETLSNNWYTLNKFTYKLKLQDNSWVTQVRESYDRGNGAAVLLYNTKNNTVILTKQFRMPTYVNGNTDGYLIEACAGLLDNDNPEDCIKKEILEETGYKIDTVTKVMQLFSSPGSVTEQIHYFIAPYTANMKVNDGGGLIEETEDIEVLELPFNNVLAMVNTGEIRDAKTIILIQYAQLHGLLKP